MKQLVNFLTLILICSCGQGDKKNITSNDLLSINMESNIGTSNQKEKIFTKKFDNGLKFEIDSTTEVGLKILNILRDEKKILSHTLFKIEGDCSSVNLELGKYKLIGNEIIFYTFWAATDRQKIALYPFGFRKQTYSFKEKGKLSKQSTELFIEDTFEKEVGKEIFYTNPSSWEHKGLEFIYKTPKNDFEKKAKEDYIKKIEKIYAGIFVFGDAKKALEKEVRSELHNEIKLNTDHWKEGEEYGYGTVKK